MEIMSASYIGVFCNCNIFISEMKNNIYYDIKIEHWYSVKICCILMQISLH